MNGTLSGNALWRRAASLQLSPGNFHSRKIRSAKLWSRNLVFALLFLVAALHLTGCVQTRQITAEPDLDNYSCAKLAADHKRVDPSGPSHAFWKRLDSLVLRTRYATIHYESENQLNVLNQKLVLLAASQTSMLRQRKPLTVQDEVAAKIDIIVEQIQLVLEMVPEKLQFDILLFSTAQDAQRELCRQNGERVNFISFYSRSNNSLYLSVMHSDLGIVSHELGHVVVEHYFARSLPVKIHELLAQYTEVHIGD
jgi:hypothetical protein